MRMKVTMQDVAAKAGVSAATVSHVINNTRFVSDETTNKVLASIQELGYIPDPIGRSLKTGKKNLIGFIVPDIANLVWSVIIEEVERIIALHGSKLIVSNTKETASRELESIQLLASGIVDGLIVASTLSDFEDIRKVVPENFPLVFLDREIKNCPSDVVISQDYDAFYQGVQRFIFNGHKHIGLITGLESLSTSKIRLAAYKAAMEDHNLPIDPDFIQIGYSTTRDSIPILQKLLAAKCTAIVISNNIMLNDVLRDLHKLNVHVGNDIEILGQGVEGMMESILSPIHFVVQPSIDMGRQAGICIINRIENPDSPARRVVLPMKLLARENLS